MFATTLPWVFSASVPLSAVRARMVDESFFDLGGDIHGTLPRQMLKRRGAVANVYYC